MDELQSDDLYIPAFLLNLPSDFEIDEKSLGNTENFTESFMKNIENWSECCLDECLE
jgi:hypothetical protein